MGKVTIMIFLTMIAGMFLFSGCSSTNLNTDVKKERPRFQHRALLDIYDFRYENRFNRLMEQREKKRR